MKFSATVSTPAAAIGVGPSRSISRGVRRSSTSRSPNSSTSLRTSAAVAQCSAAQEDTGAGAAAAANREAADVAHVVEALEAHPPVDHDLDPAKTCGFV